MENDDTLWPPLTNGKGRKEKKKKNKTTIINFCNGLIILAFLFCILYYEKKVKKIFKVSSVFY